MTIRQTSVFNLIATGISISLLLMTPLSATFAAKGGNKGGNGGGNEGGIEIIDPSDVTGFDVHIIGTDSSEEIIGTSGRDLIEGSGGRDEVSGMGGDDVIYGGTDRDILNGDEGDDILHGEDGEDWLDGGPGIDQLYGGAADFDILLASPGPDLYDGGMGHDFISFEHVYSVTVTLDGGGLGTFEAVFSAGQPGEIGVFSNIEAVWGSPGDDVISGSEGPDELVGADGDDTIYGYGGDDVIGGEFGNDVIHGGDGNDKITGWGGNDWLYGDNGDDILSGPGGSEQNDDHLVGGNGCDTFKFDRSFGTDTIEDFEQGCEKIDFSDHTSRWFSGMSDVTIYPQGADLIVELSYKAWGEITGGTIVVKNGSSLQLTADDFILP